MDQISNTITVPTKQGERTVTLHVFPALTGFELNRRYRTDYRLSSDTHTRTTYALDVLTYAEFNGKRLDSEKAVNDALVTWQNLEKVFQAVLAYNDVDLELAEEKARWFEFAGKELAETFVAEAALMMGPLLKSMDQRAEQGA
jgi:hypothetical protein